jgi:hypothetical protein
MFDRCIVPGTSPKIALSSDDARDGFGAIILNPHLGLKAGTPVTLTVKVLPLKK